MVYYFVFTFLANCQEPGWKVRIHTDKNLFFLLKISYIVVLFFGCLLLVNLIHTPIISYHVTRGNNRFAQLYANSNRCNMWTLCGNTNRLSNGPGYCHLEL